jgi:glucose/arabinose dehydrogenase
VAIASTAAACDAAHMNGAPPGHATGVVIAADGPSAAEVDRFTLRTADGQALQFTVGRLDLTNGGLPSAHLREHMVSGEPITVYYYGTEIIRYTDANQPTSSPTVRPTPTGPSNAPGSPSPFATPTGQPTQAVPLRLDVEPFADGFQGLTFLTNAGDGTGRLYAVEQRGVIWRIAADGTKDGTPFLDISDRVGSGGERGLLGLAFHPDFARNGRLFVDYTDRDGNTVVSELGLGPDGYADSATERFLFGIEQPFGNHNGGMLAFGPDGYLYIGTGDGGSGGDPLGNGQSVTTLLGKILRIDIDSGDPYGIPPGNPFAVGQIPEVGHGRPEIWDWGMRNPWRFSFDRDTGALWIGDVGQGEYEEVDAEPAGAGGRNYGWNVMEGRHCYAIASCDEGGLTLPVTEYSHQVGGCSITGGYVYRGQAYPALLGQFVFSDYCSGNLWAIDAAAAQASGSVDLTQYGNAPINPTSFGEDEASELYLVNGAGQIFRVTAD